MKNRLNCFLFTNLLGVGLLAGCAATDVQMRTEDGSTSVRERGQVNTETKSESTRGKSSGQTEPAIITYRPGG
jgi:hypothetical protein